MILAKEDARNTLLLLCVIALGAALELTYRLVGEALFDVAFWAITAAVAALVARWAWGGASRLGKRRGVAEIFRLQSLKTAMDHQRD